MAEKAKVAEITWDSDAPYGAEGIRVLPGVPNRVADDARLEKFLKNPGVKARIDAGKLKVNRGVSADAPEARSTDTADLSDMNAPEAVDRVKSTDDVALLNKMKKAETRVTVTSAIDARIEELRSKK